MASNYLCLGQSSCICVRLFRSQCNRIAPSLREHICTTLDRPSVNKYWGTGSKYPAFVIFPQCPAGERWAEYNKQNSFNDNAETPDESKNEKAIICLIEKLVADYPIDTDRLYITGLSMGGMGTFDLVCRHPDLFAAAIPICGAVNPTRLPAAKNVRFRIFHGANDDSVPTIWSRKAYKALKDAGAEVEYIEFAGTPHDSWNPAFNRPDFLPWLFSQKKK